MPANRQFTPEFRISAAQRIVNGECVSAISKELQITRSVLYRWRDHYKQEGRSGLQRPIGRPRNFGGTSKQAINTLSESEKRIGELESQVEQLASENGFLKRVLRRMKEGRLKSSASHS